MKDNEQNASKLNINWFPGHMTKAKREMQEKLKMVDMVIECRDARIPYSSKNPLLEEIIQQKPRLILLTKIDKADPVRTKEWIDCLSNDTTQVLAVNVLKDNVVSLITTASQECMKAMIERQKRRGINPRAIRAMVVGIPNVGKSTLINRIANKKAVQAADRPGVTRSLTWVKVTKGLELLDTPGVLWPKFEDEHVGMCLAVTGAIRDEILPLEEVCAYAMRHLIQYYPQQLKERFDVEIVDDPYVMIERIAARRGFIKANNQLDMDRAIQRFLRDIRDDFVGRITWEFVDETGE
ncbi:ribosome biogenesis GTPase YlqF [Dielma fastidiosa]|uniref:Ribosome biogenesis GTPase A n=1 Tax=Dielma fastidiosa TaxID=1034346 RepID=A0A318KJH5_9FIRM|nr:ribosome biogenesis GTPase YlqF [Dielma fastidiosa]PXX77590.1 ribosome biogenesis GTPase A [Dielma fastidiosa]RHN02698.1 ribosome biogenesis GTPase YlqF [Dielma fastidiosa]